MSDQRMTQEPGMAEQSKGAAKDVAQTATSHGKEVANQATDKATEVAETAKAQVQSLAGQATDHVRKVSSTAVDEARQQADQRLSQLAGSARQTSDQLHALLDGRVEEAGGTADLVRDAAERLGRFSDRVDQGGLQGVADDVSSFARRRPLLFLAGAGLAGFALSRTLRSASGSGSSSGSGSTAPSGAAGDGVGAIETGTPQLPAGYGVEPGAPGQAATTGLATGPTGAPTLTPGTRDAAIHGGPAADLDVDTDTGFRR